jgi:hypothetical protein
MSVMGIGRSGDDRRWVFNEPADVECRREGGRWMDGRNWLEFRKGESSIRDLFSNLWKVRQRPHLSLSLQSSR